MNPELAWINFRKSQKRILNLNLITIKKYMKLRFNLTLKNAKTRMPTWRLI